MIKMIISDQIDHSRSVADQNVSATLVLNLRIQRNSRNSAPAEFAEYANLSAR